MRAVSGLWDVGHGCDIAGASGVVSVSRGSRFRHLGGRSCRVCDPRVTLPTTRGPPVSLLCPEGHTSDIPGASGVASVTRVSRFRHLEGCSCRVCDPWVTVPTDVGLLVSCLCTTGHVSDKIGVSGVASVSRGSHFRHLGGLRCRVCDPGVTVPTMVHQRGQFWVVHAQ